MTDFDPKILYRLARNGIPENEFEALLDGDEDLLVRLSQGMNITLDDGLYHFTTSTQSVNESVFCIVDVETNGSKTAYHQIIEIGAVKYHNRTIIDTFESLVYCDSISDQIAEITGIALEQTLKAPDLASVMRDFRLFLDDAVFVGHDAKFDYKFVSAMMERVGLGKLLNRQLCTIDLAERTFEAERYGLKHLNEFMNLYEEARHHRALSDAITTTKLFEQTLKMVPETIHTTEELIAFSKEAPRKKRLKPSLAELTDAD